MVNLELGDERVRLPDFALPVKKSGVQRLFASRTLAPNLGVQQIERGTWWSVCARAFWNRVATYARLVILDVAHNPHAACWLAKSVAPCLQHPETRIHAVYGALG